MQHKHQAARKSPTRRGLMAAGLATMGLSLMLSIGPALAAGPGNPGPPDTPGNGNPGNGNPGVDDNEDSSGSGGGNSGTVKVIDAALGTEPLGNDPKVCEFYLLFEFATPGQSGSWEIVTMPDGPAVAQGVYETDDATTAQTEPMTTDEPGLHRVNWQGTGDNTWKHKQFTVSSDCPATDDENTDPQNTDPENTDPQNTEPENSDPENSEPQNSDPETSDPENSEPQNSDPENSDPENSDPQNTDPENSDSQNTDPQNTDPQNTDETDDPGNEPEGDVAAGQSGLNSSGGTPTELPDTSVPVHVGSGLLGTVGLLMVIGGHRGGRRPTRPVPVPNQVDEQVPRPVRRQGEGGCPECDWPNRAA